MKKLGNARQYPDPQPDKHRAQSICLFTEPTLFLSKRLVCILPTLWWFSQPRMIRLIAQPTECTWIDVRVTSPYGEVLAINAQDAILVGTCTNEGGS